MYQQIYGVAATKVEKEEEKKGDDEADEEAEGEAKPKKKVKFGKEVGVITVYKQKRGGRKTISQIVGFEHYTKDMKGLASKFGKKFSCGCNLATDDIHGDCISVQGDVEDRLLEILEQDKELAEFKIDPKKIKFIDDGNKKGRKRPPPKAKEE
jgi:density-regulated protein DRP1